MSSGQPPPRAHNPRNTGFRFSAKARGPSLASSLRNTAKPSSASILNASFSCRPSVALMVRRIAWIASGPLAIQAILRTIRETEGLHENDAFKIDAELGLAVFRSEDAKEGPRAFAEKRKPVFRGL